MRLTYQDILLSREWADMYRGEDDGLDVLTHKLLSFALKQHEDAIAYHDGQAAKIRTEMAELESRFKVSGDVEF